MLNFLGEITKLYRRQSVTIDNRSFYLNRVVTLGILIFCFLVQVGTTFFKTPIDCIGEKDLKDFANVYCYVHSTFSVKANSAHLPQHANVGVGDGVEFRHDYYQWVTLALIAQAALTYLPSYLWKSWEGGRIKSLASGLQTPCIPSEMMANGKSTIKQFLLQGMHHQHLYFLRFALCDILNLAVVIIQLYFINFMVGNVFTIFGFGVLKVLGANPLNRSDNMAYVFPTMAKCLVPKFGPSGRHEVRDYLCVLPFNLINEKMYTVLWVWFSLLTLITIAGLSLGFFTLISKSLRALMLQLYCHPGHTKSVEKVVSSLDVADWFVLRQIGKNVNTTLFTEIIDELAHELTKTPQVV